MGAYLDLDDVVADNPVAKAELAALRERLEDVLTKDRGKTREINILTTEDTALRAQLREAEALIGSDALAWPDRYRAYRAKYPEASDAD